MKKALVLLALTIITTALLPHNNWAQGKNKKTGNATGKTAAAGDEVWVAVNTIKADKREQFEKFIFEIFWPAAKKLSQEEQKAFNYTRVLTPKQANEDGTYTYIFIMDPVIPGAHYQIEKYLIKMYGEKKGAEYWKVFEETAAKPQIGYAQKQSRLY
jgi:hypothetical protein